jgi:hypothetical protein
MLKNPFNYLKRHLTRKIEVSREKNITLIFHCIQGQSAHAQASGRKREKYISEKGNRFFVCQIFILIHLPIIE